MGGGDSKPNPPPSRPVPPGKIRICIVGFKLCPPAGKAHELAGMIAQKLPQEYETWYYWDASGPFYSFTAEKFADVPFPEHLKGHSSSPFVWLERAAADGSGKNVIEPIGGCDHFREWIQKNLAGEVEIAAASKDSESMFTHTVHVKPEWPQSTADVSPIA